ncbi:rhomboid family intramembrane serine protease [Natronolimnohabitans sp. A-GB9]|uniref:rhomboid family intramembrane serine protease n=1 Tax=Natronolimnohabitans sp. A-GB9 TaxID=3069757 RepID=UPI0027B38796|nr:rhomboid family intramembrane serine protease [Natronolimnohabitans sp. A-GB9]MDQ2048891.1 rhomboid family intramembrane serine protease [Natronolimnohabitans sp. A-GB9]
MRPTVSPLTFLETVVLPLVIAATILVSVAVVRRLHRADDGRRWVEIARSRLVMGVPWGSLLVIALVFCVYLFVQDGITDFENPVTLPYRAYSYFYPLGMLTASFSHAGPGHLLGNLAGTAVVAPIAEYAWGHYPDGRDEGTVSSWRANPWVRALVVFPAIVVAITIATSLFALGPVIGFSGVVFAFAGFALVHYPIVTIVGVLGVQSALLTVYRAMQTPIAVYVAQPSPPSAPSWAGIAIQGHALGFFIGLGLGVALLRRRGHRPDPFHLWIALLLYGFAQGLWQIYWFGSENTYFLFQGPGVLIVTALALVVTVAITASDRPLLPRRVGRRLARLWSRLGVTDPTGESPVDRPLEIARASAATTDSGTSTSRLERIATLAAERRRSTRLAGVGRRQAAMAVVLVVFAIVAGMAIPVNLFVLDDASGSAETAVEIEDYTVQYAEDVENEMVSPVQIGPLADAVSLESSGVIVESEQRQLWSEVVPADRLAFTGEEEITVGGPGWRETVHVERTGWEPVDNDTVYQVEIWADGEDRQLTHESNASSADVRIDDRTVTVDSRNGTFVLAVESPDGVVETAAVPEENESATANGLAFERDDETVYATSDGTEVAVASAETYN